MFESKYSKVLTAILVIVIIAIVGLLGFLGYEYYKNYIVSKDTSEFVDEFQGEVAEGDPTAEDNQGNQEGNRTIRLKRCRSRRNHKKNV